MNFKNIILFPIMICLASCFPAKTEENPFWDNLKEFASSSEEIINLKVVIDFDWDEFCMFYSAESAPKSAYLAYSEYVSSINFSKAERLNNKNKKLFVVFKQNEVLKQISSRDAFIEINESKYFLKMRVPNSRTGGCLKNNIQIEKLNIAGDEFLIFSER